jgi:uncharacterized membrane protein
MTDEDISVEVSTVAVAVPAVGVGRSKLKTFLLALAVVSFNAVGNLFLAWGMKHSTETVALNPLAYVRAIMGPFVAVGIAFLIIWLLTRMALMSWADLSFALPLTGLGYVLAAVLGKVFLDESVSSKHWVGTLLIFTGVVLVGTTAHQTGLRETGR